MYAILKYKMGNIEELMNPKNPKILSDLLNKLVNDVQTSQTDVSLSTFVKN